MRQNPVYSREMKVSARSPRFPLILSLFNGILCLAALINMYSVVLRVRTNATIQYSSFMDIYEFVTAIEFILLMFIVPAVGSQHQRRTGEADIRSDAYHPDDSGSDCDR